MISKKRIEQYLYFLLRNRMAVSIVIAVMTVFFAYQTTHVKVTPNFLDFYPGPSSIKLFGHEWQWRAGHPYIKIYNDFRRMFGSANVLTVILEKKPGTGDVYNPTTLQKLDTITRRLVETKGVVPYQIQSIAHPKMKSLTTYGGAIQIREVFFPGVPKTQEDADRVKFAVYSTRGIRGLYVSDDDTRRPRARRFLGRGSRLQLPLRSDDAAESRRRGREPHRLHHRLPVAVHVRAALRPRGTRGVRRHHRRPVLPPVELLPHLDGRVGADLLGSALQRLGARPDPADGTQPRSAGAGRADLPLGTRTVALGPVDGPLSRGVPQAARQEPRDRRVVRAPVPAGDRLGAERRHRHPAGRHRADSAHPEGRGVLELLDHLDHHQRGDAAPDHPLGDQPARASTTPSTRRGRSGSAGSRSSSARSSSRSTSGGSRSTCSGPPASR